MSDIIRLLPDAVANQIAAGEVIQRPASAVKELLENAIDAGADQIQLIVKDSGRTLIQVIDNGCGMSPTDARLAFERHATSKITRADDLFRIRTMGFRGEALASIASVAQVELRTRMLQNELGTLLRVEGSRVKEQDAVACQSGTSIAVRNLFFNVPARRNFLKSHMAESRHILEEFSKVALAWPQLSFTLIENDKVRFQLPESSLKDRIVRLFGTQYKEHLVEVDSTTNLLRIHGFVGKPDIARKTRGEQYFLVNRRFIRHPYLHHAVENGFEGLLAEGSFPSYFLFMEIDPERIDVNIHPTKAEVNFQDSQVIYNLMKVAVRQALGKFSITPRLDFDTEPSFDAPFTTSSSGYVRPPSIKVNTDYNPFRPAGAQPWQKAFEDDVDSPGNSRIPAEQLQAFSSPEMESDFEERAELMQIHGRYIISSVKSGVLIIDQHLAHERILYEQFLNSMSSGTGVSQQKLFPQMIELSPADASLMDEILPELPFLGFDVSPFGDNSYIINGTPAGLEDETPARLLESVLEQYKKDQGDLKLDVRTQLARSLAFSLAIPYGKKLSTEEMKHLIDQLFACISPEQSLQGKSILSIISLEELGSRFRRA